MTLDHKNPLRALQIGWVVLVDDLKGIRANLLLAGPGTSRGEKVRIEKSNELEAGTRRVDGLVEVFIPAIDDFEVGVEFASRLLVSSIVRSPRVGQTPE